MGIGQHAGGEAHAALAERGIQVEGADDAFLAGAQRQGDEAPAVEQVGHAARQSGLGHAARAFDQHAAQGRIDGRPGTVPA